MVLFKTSGKVAGKYSYNHYIFKVSSRALHYTNEYILLLAQQLLTAFCFKSTQGLTHTKKVLSSLSLNHSFNSCGIQKKNTFVEN